MDHPKRRAAHEGDRESPPASSRRGRSHPGPRLGRIRLPDLNVRRPFDARNQAAGERRGFSRSKRVTVALAPQLFGSRLSRSENRAQAESDQLFLDAVGQVGFQSVLATSSSKNPAISFTGLPNLLVEPTGRHGPAETLRQALRQKLARFVAVIRLDLEHAEMAPARRLLMVSEAAATGSLEQRSARQSLEKLETSSSGGVRGSRRLR